jgi:hypothetical protein
MEEFEFELVVSVLVVALIYLAMPQAAGSLTPLFALALLALSQAGYFCLEQLRKNGMGAMKASLSIIAAGIVCFALSLIAHGSDSLLLPTLFIPIIFCTPGVASLVQSYMS